MLQVAFLKRLAYVVYVAVIVIYVFTILCVQAAFAYSDMEMAQDDFMDVGQTIGEMSQHQVCEQCLSGYKINPSTYTGSEVFALKIIQAFDEKVSRSFQSEKNTNNLRKIDFFPDAKFIQLEHISKRE